MAEAYLVPALAIGFLTLLTAVVYLLPAELVLPALSVAALLAAFAVALTTWLSPRLASLRPINGWDIAGALTLIGCAAAIMGEIEPLIEFLKPLPERSPTRV
jgi:hypothetical protein